MEAPFWSKRVEEAGYIQPRIHRWDDQVEAATDLLQRAVLFGIVDVVRAELVGLGFLAVAPGEGMNLTTPLVGKLYCHMAEPAYSDDSDAGGGRHFVDKEWCEDRDATAKQRTYFRHI